MKSGRFNKCFLLKMVICALAVCDAHSASVNAYRGDGVAHEGVDNVAPPQTLTSAGTVSVKLGTVHMTIPRAYLGTGSFAIQTPDHIVLDVQLPNIRPMTKEERFNYVSTGLRSTNTAHIILDFGTSYLYGDKLFPLSIRNKSYGAELNSELMPEESGTQNIVKYHDGFFHRDVYLLKNSSPKLFFECKEERKFIVRPECQYFGSLPGNIRFQILYDKNSYMKSIFQITPKIRALLLSFIQR